MYRRLYTEKARICVEMDMGKPIPEEIYLELLAAPEIPKVQLLCTLLHGSTYNRIL